MDMVTSTTADRQLTTEDYGILRNQVEALACLKNISLFYSQDMLFRTKT